MAVVLAIYGFVDLVLLFAAALLERAKAPLHALGISKNWKHASRKEEAIERMCQLGESAMRRTKTNAKGQVTIPAELGNDSELRRALASTGKKSEVGWC